MEIVHSDSVFKVDAGTDPNYNKGNSLLKLLGLVEQGRLAASRETYPPEQLQYLIPFEFAELFGPRSPNTDTLDPRLQDNKEDFQKQNIRDFRTTDTYLVRGWAWAGSQLVPFLRVSYQGGPDSQLSQNAGHQLSDKIKLWIKIRDNSTPDLITVPYNPDSDRYEVELWNYPDGDLRGVLDAKGRDAMDRGELIVRNDLILGTAQALTRENLNEKFTAQIAPDHTLHPIIPLSLELAWSDESTTFWDSKGGANYQYQFNMILRGWDSYLKAGISPNPHGGVGFLEYRNLMSNYENHKGWENELGRQLNPWNFDAHESKDHGNGFESFMAVDYMDLHLLKPECGIGLHRHRDNQEVFMMMEGRGYMVVGDWIKMANRERCFEIRTLRSGHFAMLKGGQFHGLMNPSDGDMSLFMFGGYD